MAESGRTGNKCIAKIGNGRRCNKPVYQETPFCKKHGINPHSQKKKVVKKKEKLSRNTKIGIILGALLSLLIALIFYVIQIIDGPTRENQEQLKQGIEEIQKNQKFDQKNSDTIKQIFRQFIPTNDEYYETGKKVFVEKQKEYDNLFDKISRAKKDLANYYDSLRIWESQMNKMVNEWEMELKGTKVLYKQLKSQNTAKLERIFEYGYATYLISPDNKAKLIDSVSNPMVSIDWNFLKWKIDDDHIESMIPYLEFHDLRSIFERNREKIRRKYEDLGRLYYSTLSSGTIRTVFSIIADNDKGIMVLIGFKKKEIPKSQNKNV